jgi:dihydropyrimidinase
MVIRGGKLVLPGYGIREADLAIRQEQVGGIFDSATRIEAAASLDARGLYVLPGAIDPHTHWNRDGDIAAHCALDTRAAALGGVTTALVFERALPATLEILKRTAESLATIDFVLTPILFNESGIAVIDELVERECSSFKFYLAYRNLPNAPPGDGWNELTDGLMLEALEQLAHYEGTVACIHAENPEIINRRLAQTPQLPGDGLKEWEAANPAVAEAEAILRAGFLAEQSGATVYFVHISGENALESLQKVKAFWPNTYGETCPHYLFHNVETSPATVKFSPPVRHRQDNKALWDALQVGLLDSVGSDNIPTSAERKKGSVWDIARGGPGTGILLPMILSEGVNQGRLSLERAVEVTSTNAARIFGLYPKKGSLHVGADADLTIVDLNLKKAVGSEFSGVSDYNLYTDVEFTGWPILTMVRGEVVARDGRIEVEAGFGRSVPRRAVPRVPLTTPASDA